MDKLEERGLLVRRSGPQMFVANVNNGCSTSAGTDVVFPSLGSQVSWDGDQGKRAPPVGNCGRGSAGMGGGVCNQKDVLGYICGSGARALNPAVFGAGAVGVGMAVWNGL